MSAARPPGMVIKGRYVLADRIAVGGMASVHLGKVLGEGGFARVVAIKRLHAQFAGDAEFLAMFLDEARLVARIRHPNVVPTLDVVSLEDELFIVMELVIGESLSKLVRAARKLGEGVPVSITSGVVVGALHGLHAAHEARDERGKPLDLVHRDVTPHNILVGVDGVPRLIDFGVAKAAGQLHATREGQLKGKIPYMSPEQIQGLTLDRRSDVYAAGVVLWELLAGRRLFEAPDDVSTALKILDEKLLPPSHFNPSCPKELDEIVLRALCREASGRHATAREMAIDIERACPCASGRAIGEWVDSLARETLGKLSATIAQFEHTSEVGLQAGKPLPLARREAPEDDTQPSIPTLPEDLTHTDDVRPPARESPPSIPTRLSQPTTRVEPLRPPRDSVPDAGSSVSQISRVSLSSEAHGAPPPSRWSSSRAALAAAALASVASGVWFLERSSGSPAPSPPPLASASAEPPPAAAAPVPSASASAVAPVAGSAGKATEKPRSKPVEPKAQKPDCSSPYLKGPNGVLKIKPGCL